MMEFIVGYDVKQFEEYYRTLQDLHDFYIAHNTRLPGPMELGDDERGHVESDLSHLIVWKENERILGHAIWHETSTDEMTPGSPRTGSDREALHKIYGGSKENLVELHEVWLQTEHRGKGHGRRFFSFFEDFVRERGFDGIVYYTDDPSGVALCRNRGYHEGYLETEGWYVFATLFDK